MNKRYPLLITALTALLLLPSTAWATEYPIKIGNDGLGDDNLGSYPGVSVSLENDNTCILTLDNVNLGEPITWTGASGEYGYVFNVVIKGQCTITTGDNSCFVTTQDSYISFSPGDDKSELILTCNNTTSPISTSFKNSVEPFLNGLYMTSTSEDGKSIVKLVRYFGITIAGQPVTKDNISTITGDGIEGTVTFDDAKNTLTLEKAKLTSSIRWEKRADLKIKLKGKSSITTTSGACIYSTAFADVPDHTRSSSASTRAMEYYSAISFEKDATSSDPCLLTLSCPEGTNVIKDFKNTADLTTMVTGLSWHLEEDSYDNNDNVIKATLLEDYNITIGDITVTSANCEDIKDPDGNSINVSYDDATKTLTFNGADLRSNITWGNNADLTINLIGNNAITYDYQCFSTEYQRKISFKRGDANQVCSLELTSSVGNHVIGSSFSNSDAPTLTGLYWLPTIDAAGASSQVTITSELLGGGNGTEESPFQIKTYDDLKQFATYVNNGTLTTEYVELKNDIDCDGKTDFEPIGLADHPFKGTFYGNRNTISNLVMTDVNSDYVGLFAQNDGIIHEINLKGCTISGGNGVGAIAGKSTNTIWKCTVSQSVVSCKADSRNPSVGGIVGRNNKDLGSCIVEDTEVKAVTSDNQQIGAAAGAIASAGGIAGNLFGSSSVVSECKVKGTTTATADYSNIDGATVYAGAVFGQNGGGFAVNTYESTVKTKTKGHGDSDYTTKSGQTQRGIGDADDVIGKVELAGTKKVTITCESLKGEYLAKEGTYYLEDGEDYYVLPNYDFTLSVYPIDGYKPRMELSDENIGVTVKDISEDGVYAHTDFTFTMPNADVTATLSFAVDIASAIYDASIPDATYSGIAQVPTTVKLSEKSGKDLFLGSNDFSIESYTLGSKTVEAPTDPDTYTVNIKGKGNYVGERAVAYIINKASLNIVSIADIDDQTFTLEAYQGSGLEPEVRVTLHDETVSSDEYSIGYSNNKLPTTEAKVTITAKATSKYFIEGTTKDTTFKIKPNKPKIDPESGEYKGEQTVSITTEIPSGASIYYYLGDNETPTQYSSEERPKISKSTKLTAWVEMNDMKGDTETATYTIYTPFENPFSEASQVWSTYYSTQADDMTLPDGLKAYIITGVGETSVELSSVGYLPKSVPLLLKKTDDLSNAVFTEYQGTKGDFSSNQLLYANDDINASGMEYVLYKNEFVKAIYTILKGKCYIELYSNSANVNSRSLSIGDGETTRIVSMDIMENEAGAQWYDLQGRRIQKPAKSGLYIVKGKLVMYNNK